MESILFSDAFKHDTLKEILKKIYLQFLLCLEKKEMNEILSSWNSIFGRRNILMKNFKVTVL